MTPCPGAFWAIRCGVEAQAGSAAQTPPPGPRLGVGVARGEERAAPTPRLGDALTGGGGARATSAPRGRRGGAWGGGPR